VFGGAFAGECPAKGTSRELNLALLPCALGCAHVLLDPHGQVVWATKTFTVAAQLSWIFCDSHLLRFFLFMTLLLPISLKKIYSFSLKDTHTHTHTQI
jgi:hypothetical protein